MRLKFSSVEKVHPDQTYYNLLNSADLDSCDFLQNLKYLFIKLMEFINLTRINSYIFIYY